MIFDLWMIENNGKTNTVERNTFSEWVLGEKCPMDSCEVKDNGFYFGKL